MLDSPSLLNVKIQSPDKTIWKGDAYAVTSKNEKGEFDILPGHANFITICIDAPLTIHLPDKKTKKQFRFDRFALLTHHNNVSVYAEI